MENSRIIWANIGDIIPNPLNPRMNFAIKTEEIQRIIREKGWEAPIICYQKGMQYLILSGHRRWYAAKKLSLKQIPVYLVKAPESQEEELERLGSVQGGKTDWSVYEWAKYTYEMWIFWGKCSSKELAHKINKSKSFVSTRLKVFQYFPHPEIEGNLATGRYSISVLFFLIGWLESLFKLKPDIVSNYKMDMLRTTMLSKIENGLVTVLDIKDDLFIQKSNYDQMKDFLLNTNKKLSDALLEINQEHKKYRGTSPIKTHLREINNAHTAIKQLYLMKDNENNKKLAKDLGEYKKAVLRKKEEIKLFIKNG